MEEAKKVKSGINRWKTRVNGWRELQHCVNVCFQHFQLYGILVSGIISTRLVSEQVGLFCLQ